MSATSESPEQTLRLIWPQWQGATSKNIDSLLPEVTAHRGRRAYAVGATVLQAVLPPHAGPTEFVPVDMSDADTAVRDGIESKEVVLRQLSAAAAILARHDAPRVLTLGGECSVSVAPFTQLAARYGDDLAVVWVDSHPDVGTGSSDYAGYHAMAVSSIIGRGDAEVTALLPATVDPTRVALAGLHSWTEDDMPNAAAWGISTFSPDALRHDSAPLLAWLAATGCTKVAVHLDVDVVDSEEVVLGLGAEPGGLSSAQVRRLVSDLQSTADVVGFTVAEYIPRQVIQLQVLLDGLPLL